MSRLEEARDRFAGDWHDFKASVRRETGRPSRWSSRWIWPVLALAAGVAAGAGVLRRRAKSD